MKHVIIVAKEGNAVGYGLDKVISKSASGSFLPNLEVIKEVLLAIPTEPSETVNIHLMNSVQGLQSGSAVEYVKTGKTVTNGAPLTQEEISAFTEVYKLYAERILNVRWSLVKFMKTADVELQNMKKKAYAELSAYERIAGTSSNKVVTTVLDPDKDLREKLTALMDKALDDGDFDKYDQLEARRDKLKAAEVVTTTASTSNNRITPKFETDLDKQIEDSIGNPETSVPDFGEATNEDSSKESNEDPIEFRNQNPQW